MKSVTEPTMYFNIILVLSLLKALALVFSYLCRNKYEIQTCLTFCSVLRISADESS